MLTKRILNDSLFPTYKERAVASNIVDVKLCRNSQSSLKMLLWAEAVMGGILTVRVGKNRDLKKN